MSDGLRDVEGRAYGIKPGVPDPVLTQVGPGTPGGELLRRYWQPVAAANAATTTPKVIRRFGEDLVLFRSRKGEAGLLTPRCIHRGTSLFFGKVEEDGIRCCYHGWKFSPQGEVLDQPCEPGGGTARNKLRQPWYPVVEKFGAIWAYMGPPDKQPLFPKYSCFENLRDDEEVFTPANEGSIEVVGPKDIDHNWYQAFDNALDHYHIPILHMRNSGPQFSSDKITVEMPEMEFRQPAPYAISVEARRPQPNGEVYVRIEQMLMPNIVAIPSVLNEGMEGFALLFWIPVDDENTIAMAIVRRTKGGGSLFTTDPDKADDKLLGFGPDKKVWFEMTPEERQRYPGDYEAQSGQGKITLHSDEHLASSDEGVVKQRLLWKRQARIVAEGGDPVGVAFAEEDRLIEVEANVWVERGKSAEALPEPV